MKGKKQSSWRISGNMIGSFGQSKANSVFQNQKHGSENYQKAIMAHRAKQLRCGGNLDSCR